MAQSSFVLDTARVGERTRLPSAQYDAFLATMRACPCRVNLWACYFKDPVYFEIFIGLINFFFPII